MNKVINTQNPELLSQNLKYSQPPTPNSKLKICVVGTRGFPNVQGGVEKHCESLYPHLVNKGCEIYVLARKPYAGNKSFDYKGVRIIPLFCFRSKFLETFLHTFTGVLCAVKLKPDVLHIHGIGPSLFVPLARILGMKVVITHHGPDYKRKKWSKFAKNVLRLGEFLGMVFANRVIVISRNVAEEVGKKYKREVAVIPNGVEIEGGAGIVEKGHRSILERYGLKEGTFILSVGRFVPEKGFDILIEAFEMLERDDDFQNRKYKLVIAGGADHPDVYSRTLQEKAERNKNIILTGVLPKGDLNQLYRSAALFVLPSYYEGLPIVLLEALGIGVSCVVSDIPANREVGLSQERFFKPGDVKGLAEKMKKFAGFPFSDVEKNEQVAHILKKYNWQDISRQTLQVYKEAAGM